MKITVIGGGGRVGSCAAFNLQCVGLFAEIQLIDANLATAEGEALDLLHGASFSFDQRIYAGDYERAKDSDVFLITAGLRRQPNESRLDLINRNVSLFRNIINDIKQAGYRREAIVFVVSNPVDILTQLALQALDLPASRVIGLGTQLDTARFRSLIAAELNLPPTQINALILGEHGDSMVPIWSSATVNGLPLENFPGVDHGFQKRLFERTKGSGAEVISRKGGAGWAVAQAITDTCRALVTDQRRILPVSSWQNGCYGIRDISLSVPTLVGRAGVLSHHEIKLWPREHLALQNSAKALAATLFKVEE